MKSTITWNYSADKSVEISKAVLLKESNSFSAILGCQQDLKVASVHLKQPEAFEKHLLPVLVDESLGWKDMKDVDDIDLCHLTQIANFLGMESLVSFKKE